MHDDRRGWWTRNWKWAAPSGCLLVLLLAFGGCVAFVAGIFGMMKNTAAYTQAMDRLQSSRAAAARFTSRRASRPGAGRSGC